MTIQVPSYVFRYPFRMRAWLALVLLGAGVWIGGRMSDPVFDAAAERMCSVHGEAHGLELVDASGRLSLNRQRSWGAMEFSDYHCVFENSAGHLVFLDQFDEELNRTWESRGLRIAGWAVALGPAVAAMAAAGATGFLKRDRALLPDRVRDDQSEIALKD